MARWKHTLVEVVAVSVLAVVVALVSAGWRLARVDGPSMEPALVAGDLVVVRSAQMPKAGDIALYRAADDARPTLHRVTGSTPFGFTTRGDANPVDDRREVSRSEVAGTVRVVLPFGMLARRLRERL